MNLRLALLMAAALAASSLAPAPFAAIPSPARQSEEVRLTARQADLLRQALGDAESHGLQRRRFLPPELDRLLSSPDPALRKTGEERLVAAALAYARAVHSGGFAAFPSNWALRPEPYDPLPGFAAALAADRLAPWLATLPPADVRYAGLQAALRRYRAYAAAGGWAPIPRGRALKLGDQDPRVVALRARLAAEGEILPGEASALFDPALQAALIRFQRLHGVTADGALGPETQAALNLPVEARIGQIVANMERLRWAPRNPPATRIEVDSGSASLDFYRDGVLALSMRTIVGRPTGPTPMFRDQVESVVLNPPWNVPVAIAVKEILPKAARDAAYLARNDFVFRPGDGPLAARLQQKAGPKSALGLYKFDMPNGFDVYLHDTPARSLFDGDKRNLSHGCIRLQRPRELAEFLLGGDQAMSAEEIAAGVEAGVTRRIQLRRPVPVIVVHRTVSAVGGETAFRPDVYGWDEKLAAALAATP